LDAIDTSPQIPLHPPPLLPACGRQEEERKGVIDFSTQNVIFCSKNFPFLLRYEKMIGNKIGHRLDPYLYNVFKKIFGERGNPNLFTFLGFLATLLASFLILKGSWILAGLFIILSGIFDLFDGVVARKLGKVTTFGAFLDSVLDRYSDLFLLLSLLIYYLRKPDPVLVILASFASIGTALIPYVRARAEAANVPCSIGLMERAERIGLLSAGAILGWMEPILWILTILTHFTVLHRIYYVWKRLRST